MIFLIYLKTQRDTCMIYIQIFLQFTTFFHLLFKTNLSTRSITLSRIFPQKNKKSHTWYPKGKEPPGIGAPNI